MKVRSVERVRSAETGRNDSALIRQIVECNLSGDETMKAIDVNHKIVSSEGTPTCRSKWPKIDRWRPRPGTTFCWPAVSISEPLSRL